MTSLAIGAIDAFTPVGTNTPTTMAALLNNVQLFEEIGGLGPSGQDLTVAATPLGRSIDGLSRLSRMASLAIAECSTGAPASGRLPVVLCCPTPDDSGVKPAALLESVLANGRLRLDRDASVVVPRGRDGLADAFQTARRLVQARRTPGCLLVAVDSLLLRRRLLGLKRNKQLFDPEENPGGFVPGEGAVAIRLELPRPGETAPLVAGIGIGQDAAIDRNSTLITGSACSHASQQAMANAEMASAIPTCVAIDATSTQMGEEFAFAKTRPPFEKTTELQVFYPSICVGEAGVTTSLLAVAMLAFFMTKNVVEGPGLAITTSTGATRTAFAVRVPPAGKGR